MQAETGGRAVLRRDGAVSPVLSGGDGCSFQGALYILTASDFS